MGTARAQDPPPQGLSVLGAHAWTALPPLARYLASISVSDFHTVKAHLNILHEKMSQEHDTSRLLAWTYNR